MNEFCNQARSTLETRKHERTHTYAHTYIHVERKRERGNGNTFEILHLLPFLPVALRVHPGLRVTDLPRWRETRSRRGQEFAHHGRRLLTSDKRHRLWYFVVHDSGPAPNIIRISWLTPYTKIRRSREDIPKIAARNY